MFDNTIEKLIFDDEELRERLKQRILNIVNGDQFEEALEDNIISTIKNLDFSDHLCEIINDDDVIAPMINNIKRKLKDIFK